MLLQREVQYEATLKESRRMLELQDQKLVDFQGQVIKKHKYNTNIHK
jgi:hypothetical protein